MVLIALILLNRFARRTKAGRHLHVLRRLRRMTVLLLAVEIGAASGAEWAVNNPTHTDISTTPRCTAAHRLQMRYSWGKIGVVLVQGLPLRHRGHQHPHRRGERSRAPAPSAPRGFTEGVTTQRVQRHRGPAQHRLHDRLVRHYASGHAVARHDLGVPSPTICDRLHCYTYNRPLTHWFPPIVRGTSSSPFCSRFDHRRFPSGTRAAGFGWQRVQRHRRLNIACMTGWFAFYLFIIAYACSARWCRCSGERLSMVSARWCPCSQSVNNPDVNLGVSIVALAPTSLRWPTSSNAPRSSANPYKQEAFVEPRTSRRRPWSAAPTPPTCLETGARERHGCRDRRDGGLHELPARASRASVYVAVEKDEQ